MCLYPRLIANPKYKPNKKNGGEIPRYKDNRVLAVPIGCGDCIECRKKKANEWRVRLTEEIRNRNDAKFVSLTFNTESITKLYKEAEGLKGYDRDNKAVTIAIRRFTERWRKQFKKTIRHWMVPEIGGQRYEHVHIHGIVFTKESHETINKIWGYGFTYIGEYVNERTINYIIKYITKKDEKHKTYKPIICTSNGIGKGYTERIEVRRNKYKEEGTVEKYKARNGMETGLPIYYRNKIYTEEEREKLWIEKLNKKEQWINGQKYDISTYGGWIRFKEAQNKMRIENAILGYGGIEDWNEKKYEESRRHWLQEKRMNSKP